MQPWAGLIPSLGLACGCGGGNFRQGGSSRGLQMEKEPEVGEGTFRLTGTQT